LTKPDTLVTIYLDGSKQHPSIDKTCDPPRRALWHAVEPLFYLPLHLLTGAPLIGPARLYREAFFVLSLSGLYFLVCKHMSQKTYLTKEGLAKITAELSELKDKRDRLVIQIEEVAQADESGEDGLTTQLKEELEVTNGRIGQIEGALETVEIITGGGNNQHVVQVGCKVKIKVSGRLEKEFHIVSHLESDPSQNKISDQSPLGQALIGKRVDDEIEVDAPVGKINYKIVRIA